MIPLTSRAYEFSHRLLQGLVSGQPFLRRSCVELTQELGVDHWADPLTLRALAGPAARLERHSTPHPLVLSSLAH
jgi:hypothetical protein